MMRSGEFKVSFNHPILQTVKEITNYAFSKEKVAKANGLTFDAAEFIKRVEHTRLTTHMNLKQAFEFERNVDYIKEIRRKATDD